MDAQDETHAAPSEAQSDADGGHLSGLTEHFGLDPVEPDHDPLLGSELGGVRLERLIAEGGMGRVYEGLQDKPRRPVAVKVMRPGFVSKETCRRFDHESELLGRLRHPSIAHIHSAGICTIFGAQVPYFVMEFIPDALPITEFATRHKLTTDQRLDLFRKVCEAVAHGHEKGIVHRDLKPSNILVEPSGLPKVIDFGVARSINAAPEQMTALTDVGQLVGTVQYMSPEQFSADPSQIDTRADVYALGVILYELLTGKPPYEIRRKQIFEAAEVVRNQEPVLLSRLNRNVRPDVEKIAGTCLQKDRMRRYANAAELAHALGSYLGGLPVTAPAGTDHRHDPASRSARRKRFGLAAAGVLLIGLLATLFASRSGTHAPDAGGDLVGGSATNQTGVAPPTRPESPSLQESSAAARTAPAPAIAPFGAAQARKHQEAWAKHLGIPVETTNSTGATLVVIPPGRFTMGERDTTTVVTLTKPFLLGQTEVTQAQWREVMGTEPWKGKQYTIEGNEVAATHVSWNDAVAFCTELTERERASGKIRAEQQYRLPTEAEWEFACRAGTVTVFHCGDGESPLGDYAWFGGGWDKVPVSGGNTATEMHAHAVRLKRPNPWALFDIHGNVWEWTSDFHGNDLSGESPDQQGPSGGLTRVVRGGSWVLAASASSSATQRAYDPSRRDYDLGFRVALSAPSTSGAKTNDRRSPEGGAGPG